MSDFSEWVLHSETPRDDVDMIASPGVKPSTLGEVRQAQQSATARSVPFTTQKGTEKWLAVNAFLHRRLTVDYSPSRRAASPNTGMRGRDDYRIFSRARYKTQPPLLHKRTYDDQLPLDPMQDSPTTRLNRLIGCLAPSFR